MGYEALLQRFLGAWNSHDGDAAVALMTDDCVFECSVGPYPWGDRLEGRDKVRAWALDAFLKIPDIRWDPLRCVVGNDHAVFEFRVTGTPIGAEPFDVHACDILTFRNGMIATKRAYRKGKP